MRRWRGGNFFFFVLGQTLSCFGVCKAQIKPWKHLSVSFFFTYRYFFCICDYISIFFFMLFKCFTSICSPLLLLLLLLLVSFVCFNWPHYFIMQHQMSVCSGRPSKWVSAFEFSQSLHSRTLWTRTHVARCPAHAHTRMKWKCEINKTEMKKSLLA